VLDTEGLGGLEADQHYDTRIFSLATLLCSTLVYNSLGALDETAISNLSFVANLAQHIRLHPETSAESDPDLEAHEFHKFFPSFVWVVRDFALDLVDEYGTAVTPDEYLERALRAQVGFDAATTERNRVRAMLTAFFVDRRCVPLVRPVADEAKLQEIDKVPFDDLRPEFREGVEALRHSVYEAHLKPKEIHGRAVTGASFAALVRQYVDALESGGVPTVSTAWEQVMEHECEEAAVAGEAAYGAALEEELRDVAPGTCGADRLYHAHAAAVKKAHGVFRSRAGGDKAPRYLADLDDKLQTKVEARAKDNAAQSLELCREHVERLHGATVEPKLRAVSPTPDADVGDLDAAGDETYQDVASLKFDVQAVAAKYQAVAGGPAKAEVLAGYALGKALDAAVFVSDRLDDAREQRVAALEAQLSEAAAEAAKLAAREKVVNDALQAQQKEMVALHSAKMQTEALAKAAETRAASLLGELQRGNRRREELEQDLEDAKEALASEQTWQAQLHSRLEDLETKSSHKETRLDELGRLLDEHKSEASAKAQQLEKQRELEKSLSEKLAAAEQATATAVAAREALESKTSALEQQLEGTVAERDHQIDEKKKLAEKRDDLQAALEAARSTRDGLEQQLRDAKSEHGATARDLETSVAALKSEVEAAAEAKTAVDAELAAATERATSAEQAAEAKQREVDSIRAELDGATATHAELLRAHAQLAAEHRTFQQKMNQRVTYLKSQLDEHQSTSTTTTTELQRKAVREVELEKRLEVEINMRAALQSDKEAQAFELQKKLAEATTRLRQAEARSAQLKTSLEAARSELNQSSAQRAVLLDEKEKMQALWEKSLTDHFTSLHETQTELEQTRGRAKDSEKEGSQKVKELERKVEEYRRIVEKVQTRKEGLLRKRTRSRLVKQTWHVKLFKLVGNSLLHRDTDNQGAGEKTFLLDHDTTCEPMTDGDGKFVRNSFKVASGGEELMMAAIDRVDMQEWIDAIGEVIADIKRDHQRQEDTKHRFQSQQDDGFAD